MENKALVEIKQLSQVFKKDKHHQPVILDNINLTIYDNEIIALLGKSGSGKSTLLRLIAGLLMPTSGEIYFENNIVNKVNTEVSMVFQSFALFPWLTVFDNISFGLQAKNLPRHLIKQKTEEFIELIGLTGYEKALPKELSGGMRQRVGFARALIIEPKLLLLDEPFSALDTATTHKLIVDLINLWSNNLIKTQSMVLVTHSIEEAASLANRVIMLSSHPGRLVNEVHIASKQQDRNKQDKSLLIDEITDKFNYLSY